MIRAYTVCLREFLFEIKYKKNTSYTLKMTHGLVQLKRWTDLQCKWAASWQNQQNDCAPNEDSDLPGRICLGIRPVRSESSLCAQWVANHPSFLHADSEDSDQTGRMPRLIWVFAAQSFCWFCHEAAQILVCQLTNTLSLACRLSRQCPGASRTRFTSFPIRRLFPSIHRTRDACYC